MRCSSLGTSYNNYSYGKAGSSMYFYKYATVWLVSDGQNLKKNFNKT